MSKRGGRQPPSNGGNGKSRKPSDDGDNGRDSSGRFVKGNPGGKGNPHAVAASQFKAALYRAVTPEDLHRQALKVKELAETGERWAVELLWGYCMGKPAQDVKVNAHVTYSLSDAMSELSGVRRDALSRS